jgi:hypothetical protein
MVVDFNLNLHQALDEISLVVKKEFLVYEDEVEKNYENSCNVVELHGKVKWEIVDLLNERYGESFCLSNWLKGDDDEVSSFLNEAGSNVLNHSQFLAPYKFHLFMGSKGFVIGIEQKGVGFNALQVNKERIKDNEGRAFDFYRGCKSSIFFDDANDANVVYFKYIF